MLGALLGVVHQFLLDRQIALGRGAARACAGQWADRDLLCGLTIMFDRLLTHQDFWRSAHHMEIAKVVVVHVGAGVQRTQRAVQRQWRFGVALLDALAHLHLHEVTAGDQLLGLINRPQIISLGEISFRRVAFGLAYHRRADRVLQLILEPTKPALGVGIGLGLARVGVDDQVELARQVVDDGQLLTLQQQDVGAAEGVGRAAVRQLLLDMAHRVITEITGQTAAKTRQTGTQGYLEALLVGGDKVQRIAAGALHHHAVAHHLGFGVGAETTGAQQRARRQADKAVAAKALTADHGLQQKAVLAAILGEGQLQVQRQRGFQIGKGFRHQGDAVKALCAQAFEFEFGNHQSLQLGQQRCCVHSIQRQPQGGAGGAGSMGCACTKRQVRSLAYARARLPGPEDLVPGS